MKKIIVVDDDLAILEVIQLILEENGYEVMVSEDGNILYNLEAKPDLILLDMLLSGNDGRLIARELKNKPVTKNIPIVMISARPNAGKSAFECGADGFISKPFEIDELLTVVKNYTKKHNSN